MFQYKTLTVRHVIEIEMSSKVILWCTVRSCSTAFERAIQQADDVEVFHELYSKAYVLGPDKQFPPTVKREISTDIEDSLRLSYQDVRSILIADYNGKNMFLKDIAKTVDNFEQFLKEEMLGITHSFLIRSPDKALKSLYHMWLECPEFQEDLNKFKGHYMIDMYTKQLQLYNFLSEKLNTKPVVIAIEDVLDDPEKMLRKYCEKTGLTYHEDMLNWKKPAGPQIENVPWIAYHKVAVESNRFLAPNEKESASIPEDVLKHIEECTAQCQEAYNTLYDKRLKP